MFVEHIELDFNNNMKIKCVVIAIVMVSSMVCSSRATKRHGTSHIQFINDSGRMTEIFLVRNGDLVLQTPGAMLSGETVVLNSFVNHTFFIREVPDRTGTCNAGTTYAAPSLAPCRTAFVKVNDHDDGEQNLLLIPCIMHW